MPFELLGFDTDNASRRDAPTACSSTRRCATTAGTRGSCSRAAGRGARTTRPSWNRRTAPWSGASWDTAAWKASRPRRRCRGCTRRRGCTSTSSSRRSSWHPSGATARASASATTRPRPRASGSSPTPGRLPPCANASPNWPPRWTRSGCFGRCGCISSASSTSPTGRSRSRSRRTRPSLRSSSSSPACGPPGRMEK